MSLLGSILIDPGVLPDVISLISAGEDFYASAHALIYDALVDLYDQRQSGDLVQLLDALQTKNALENVGGADYLVQLAESVPSAANAVHYARIVAEKARLRRLIEAASEIIHEAHNTGDLGAEGAREVLDRAEQRIFDIAERSQTADAQKLQELLHEAMVLLEANEGRPITGLATGYMRLDELTTGLQPGELLILAARPSMGKTALALNLAEHVALHGAHHAAAPVAFFSLEMSRQALTQRMMCARATVDSHRFRTNTLTEDDYRRLMKACGDLDPAPLYIDDTPGMTILQLRARARRLVAQHGVKCIFIDYLQLLTAPGSARESRQVEVSAISRQIKALARELNIPVVCLAQLNRGAEQREGHRPRMSDLRESGSIEQDADVIMLLHRESYYHQGDEQWLEEHEGEENLAEVIIAKQRNGPTGVAKLTWDAKTTRFLDYTEQRYREPVSYSAPTAPPEVTTFAPGTRSGPAESHRDGGGPARPWEGEESDAPF